MSRPDSCNGELPWPRQWSGTDLAAAPSKMFVVAEQSYIDRGGRRQLAVVSSFDGGKTVSPVVGSFGSAPLLRGEAVILRDLLNEVLEATTPNGS